MTSQSKFKGMHYGIFSMKNVSRASYTSIVKPPKRRTPSPWDSPKSGLEDQDGQLVLEMK